MLMSILTGSFIELITLFAIVLIHEMGHMSAAIVLGIKVRSVQLLPFGGVVSIEDHGKLTAWKEIIIALAGPLQNGIMMGIGLAFMAAEWGNIEFILYIVHGNMVIAVFNLLPILPLDGGKILQSLASRYYPYHWTLLWSSRVSIVTSVVVIIYSILPLMKGEGIIQLNILMIGIFLFYSNLIDYRNLPYRFMRFLMNRDLVYTKYAIRGSIAQPIVTDTAKHLENILRLFKREKYHLIYIMDKDGKVMSVLPEQRLISAYFSHGRRLP